MNHSNDQHEQTSLSIAMVCLNAAGVVFKRPEKNIGGMEVRAWMLAKALARQPHTQVSFVIRDIATTSSTIENVNIVPFESKWSHAVSQLSPYLTRSYSFPWLKVRRWSPRLLTGLAKLATLKFLSPTEKQTSFAEVLSTTKADIFVGFGVSYYTKYLIEAAQQAGQPSVVMIAWDGDLDERNRPGTGYVSQFGDRAEETWWILKNADQIVVQTPEQQAMLKERFDRESIILENPIDIDWWHKQSQYAESLSPQIRSASNAWLWVGRCERHHKQPQLLIQLARECPDERFLMILNPRDQELEHEIRRECPPNVTIVESVPYEQMPAVFQQSKGLISTSSQEGFPNTFLQAVVCQRPIISLNVADRFLTSSEAGICANGDWDEFVKSIKLPPRPSSQAQAYLQQHHSLDAITIPFRTILNGLKESFHEQLTSQKKQ